MLSVIESLIDVAFFDWLTLLAIVIGPVIAIWAARYLAKKDQRDDRRMAIFRDLMRTRRTTLHPDHVGALNLVEIEFADDSQIISAWKRLFEHFGTTHSPRGHELTMEHMSVAVRAARERDFQHRIAQERQELLAILLHAIAKRMNFRIEQLEVFKGGYTPQGWVDIEEEQRLIRQYAIDLYLGKRMVPVGVIDYVQHNEPRVDDGRQRDLFAKKPD